MTAGETAQHENTMKITIPIRSYSFPALYVAQILSGLTQLELNGIARKMRVPIKKYKGDTAREIAYAVCRSDMKITITIPAK